MKYYRSLGTNSFILFFQTLKQLPMKKISLFALIALGTVTSVSAQTPEKKSKAIVFKLTETWCGPCGSWGWQTAEEVISQLGDKGYYIGIMGSSSPSSMNANCQSAFQNNYSIPGYPTFLVKEDVNSQYSSQVMSLVNAFAATTPVASPAAKYSISGSTLNVTAKAKFWSAASGEYYLSAFVVEDGVMAAQNGQTGTVAHHHLMRGSMATDLSPWGQMVATGSVAINAEFSKTFSIAIKPEWKKEKLEVYVVIYKKNGTHYEYVNGAKALSGTTSIAEIQGLESAQLFPNPSEGVTHLQVAVKEAMGLQIRVTDPLGREVYASGQLKLIPGTNNMDIPSDRFANGVYMVSLIADDGKTSTQRLVISK